jgi:hypothetical protein
MTQLLESVEALTGGRRIDVERMQRCVAASNSSSSATPFSHALFNRSRALSPHCRCDYIEAPCPPFPSDSLRFGPPRRVNIHPMSPHCSVDEVAPIIQRRGPGGVGTGASRAAVCRAFPSWIRSMLTEVYLYHA